MKTLLLSLTALSALSSVANAQISVTPHIGFSSHNLKYENTTYDSATNITVDSPKRVYATGVKAGVEGNLQLAPGSELVLDLSYAGNSEVDNSKSYFMSYDFGYRHYFGDFYAQAGLGIETLKYGEAQGRENGIQNLPTAHFGLGYALKLTDSLTADIGYRGHRSIYKGESDRLIVGTLRSDAKLVDSEAHEATLGLRYAL